MEFITRRPWVVATKQCEVATKGQRVINFAVPCVLKANFLDHRHFLVPFAAAVTTVAITIYFMHGIRVITPLVSCHLRGRDLLRKQGIYKK